MPPPSSETPLEWRDYILQALVEPHIERDLLAMTPVNKPALLKRLFELGAACSGEILSYDKMVGQLQDAGNTTTLARYLDLLTTAGLLAGLQKYAGRAPRIRRSSPKLNVLNTALMTAGSGYTFEEARGRPDVLGAHRRERGRRAPIQHRSVGHPGALLARRVARSRLRTAAGSESGRHRGEERATARETARSRRIRRAVPPAPLACW